MNYVIFRHILYSLLNTLSAGNFFCFAFDYFIKDQSAIYNKFTHIYLCKQNINGPP